MYNINIAKDFSEYPGLRHCSISDDSGEEFYHRILNEKFYLALTSKVNLIVNLDNTLGFAPSFLDESFGNLVFDFGLNNVMKHIEIISLQEPYWKEMIIEDTFIKWNQRLKDGITPKVTKKHDAWYRLDENNKIQKKIWELPAVV